MAVAGVVVDIHQPLQQHASLGGSFQFDVPKVCISVDATAVFVTERKGPLTNSAVAKMIARAGEKAGFEFPVHPHMLRHACGYYLANKGHDTRAIQHYLGHRNIQHTVRYTELVSDRFNGFWTI